MPTYEYACDSCGHQFETVQSMRDDPLRVCPQCEQPALRRLIFGGTGVIFKGSGFYVNDSKKNGKSSSSVSSTKKGEETGSGGSSDSASTGSETTTPSAEKGSTDSKRSGASGEKKPTGAGARS